ncbi:hypothetical protein STENM327S_00347 [Streptomyces tendae]
MRSSPRKRWWRTTSARDRDTCEASSAKRMSAVSRTRRGSTLTMALGVVRDVRPARPASGIENVKSVPPVIRWKKAVVAASARAGHCTPVRAAVRVRRSASGEGRVRTWRRRLWVLPDERPARETGSGRSVKTSRQWARSLVCRREPA